MLEMSFQQKERLEARGQLGEAGVAATQGGEVGVSPPIPFPGVQKEVNLSELWDDLNCC